MAAREEHVILGPSSLSGGVSKGGKHLKKSPTGGNLTENKK